MERSRKLATTRIVIFDLGEVLATPPDLYGRLATRISRDEKAVEAAYWAYRDDYDRGGNSDQFWGSVLRDVGDSTDPAVQTDLSDIDTEAWTVLREDSVQILKDLSDRGVRVGILSNAPLAMAAGARSAPWADYVADWFFSGELKIAKPDPSIYVYVTAEVGLAPESIVFIDDRQVNVDAAVAQGWNAYLWESGSATRALLESLGLL